jgi:hypothetical protein
MARYVVVENTFASGHLYEIPLLEAAGVVVAVLQEEGRGASFMPDESILKNALFERFFYTPETLREAVAAATAWAERKVAEVTRLHAETRNAWTSRPTA